MFVVLSFTFEVLIFSLLLLKELFVLEESIHR